MQPFQNMGQFIPWCERVLQKEQTKSKKKIVTGKLKQTHQIQPLLEAKANNPNKRNLEDQIDFNEFENLYTDLLQMSPKKMKTSKWP